MVKECHKSREENNGRQSPKCKVEKWSFYNTAAESLEKEITSGIRETDQLSEKPIDSRKKWLSNGCFEYD